VLLVGVEGAVVAIAITPRSGQPNPVPLDDVAAELQPLIDSITFD